IPPSRTALSRCPASWSAISGPLGRPRSSMAPYPRMVTSARVRPSGRVMIAMTLTLPGCTHDTPDARNVTVPVVRRECLTLVAGLADVLVVGGKGPLERARPAKPLEPWRRLGVVHVGIVTAARADELEQVSVAALEAAVLDADRLAPHECGPAMTVLTGRRKRDDVLGLDAEPGGAAVGRARPGDDDRMRGRPVTVHDCRVYGTAHSTHRRASDPCRCQIRGSGVRLSRDDTLGRSAANAKLG